MLYLTTIKKIFFWYWVEGRGSLVSCVEGLVWQGADPMSLSYTGARGKGLAAGGAQLDDQASLGNTLLHDI